MKKPVKPVKKRAPKVPEKPVEVFDTKEYRFSLSNFEDFNLDDFLKNKNIPINQISFKDVYIDIDFSTCWGDIDNDSYLVVTVPERHKNPNYDQELKVYEKRKKESEKYEKYLLDYEKKLAQYNERYPKWLKEEEKRLEKEKIEAAKKLLEEKGLL